MKEEEKQLLLKDICSRLPYGIRYKGDGGWGINPYQHSTSLCTILTSEEPLVYLRPMSSMTEKEEEEYDTFFNTDYGYMDASKVFDVSDWMYAHHFDFRGLIDKGLALEAPEGTYKTE